MIDTTELAEATNLFMSNTQNESHLKNINISVINEEEQGSNVKK